MFGKVAMLCFPASPDFLKRQAVAPKLSISRVIRIHIRIHLLFDRRSAHSTALRTLLFVRFQSSVYHRQETLVVYPDCVAAVAGEASAADHASSHDTV